MKKFLITMLIIIIVFSGLGFATYKAYESGLIEEKVSKLSIPFNWFYNYDLENVRDLEVSNDGLINIEDYKKSIVEVTNKFSIDNKERPDIRTSNIDTKSINMLDTLFNEIYGVENTYIYQFIVSGISQTNKGWGPLLTISVLDDTEQVKNITFSSTYKDGKISDIKKISETVDSFWYSDIPNDYRQSIISSGITATKNYINNEVYNKSTIELDKKTKDLFQFINNSRLSSVYVYASNQVIEITYSVGTDKGIDDITFNYNTIDNSISSIK